MHNPCFSYRHGFCWWENKEEDLCSHCATKTISQDTNTIHRVHGMEFPVLSVNQPYALMLVDGKKEFEYRSWKLPEKYVGKRIFIQATRMSDCFNPQFAEYKAYKECDMKCMVHNLYIMILGSVVFGDSQGPIDCVVRGQKMKFYKWPVIDPIRLENPLYNISGRQRIWKIKF